MQEKSKERIRNIIKYSVLLSSIFFAIKYKFPFFLGFVYGSAILSFMYLFPTPLVLMILDKTFNYSKSQTEMLKHEAENNRRKTVRTVKYKYK